MNCLLCYEKQSHALHQCWLEIQIRNSANANHIPANATDNAEPKMATTMNVAINCIPPLVSENGDDAVDAHIIIHTYYYGTSDMN